MGTGEISKAMGGYSSRFVTVTSAKLSEYLGIELKKAKRNGLSQKEHLEKIAAEKSAHKRQLVFDFLEKDPEATQRKMATILGMSTTTVRKYKKEYFMTRTGSE